MYIVIQACFLFFLGLVQQVHGGGSGSHWVSLVSIRHNACFSGPFGVTNSSSILQRRSPFAPTFATYVQTENKHLKYQNIKIMVALDAKSKIFIAGSTLAKKLHWGFHDWANYSN